MKSVHKWSCVFLVIIILSLTACSQKDPREILTQALNNTIELNSYKSSVNIGLKITTDSTDVGWRAVLALIKETIVDGVVLIEANGQKSHADIELSTMGPLIDIEYYISQDLVAMEMPLLNKAMGLDDMYVVTSREPQSEGTPAGLLESLLDSVNSDVSSKDIEITKGTYAQTPRGQIKGNTYTWVIPSSKIEGVLQNMMADLMGNLAPLNNIIQCGDMEISLLVDKNGLASRFDFSSSLVLEMTDKISHIYVDFTGTSVIWDADIPIDIEFPNLTTENIIESESILGNSLLPF